MKTIRIFSAGLIFTFLPMKAQIANPVKWQAGIEKQTANRYLVTVEANIGKGWHLYSQFTPDGGPAPLELKLAGNRGTYQTVGKATESTTHTAYNKTLGVYETFFIGKARIKQLIKTSNSSVSSLHITLAYQLCKQVCVPQEVNFEFDTKTLQARQVPQKNR